MEGYRGNGAGGVRADAWGGWVGWRRRMNEKVGGWVGGWVGWRRRMNEKGGWVGGWVGGGYLGWREARGRFEVVRLGGWVGGWVGG